MTPSGEPASVAEYGARIMNRIAEALHASASVTQTLERALDEVAELLGLQTGWVWLIEPQTCGYYAAASRSLPPFLREPVNMIGVHCRCISELEGGRLTSRNVAVLECSRLERALSSNACEETDGLRYHATIPLYARGVPLGIMNVSGPRWRPLTDDELGLLSAIADQVGIAIERARHAETAAELARAEERTRLAREIHDTLAQSLAAISLQLETALVRLDDEPRAARSYVERALEVSRASIDEARRSVLSLRARPLEAAPLSNALVALARSFSSETGIRVATEIEAKHPITAQAEDELLRIAQEALANVRRHAGARAVQLTLCTTPRSVRLTVADDGTGFSVARVPARRHGLRGMRERARLLGGSVRVRSALGAGTAVTASVPR
jgi:two-component system NarL family sensor kinase